MVSIETESYAVARSYVIRIEKSDLTNKASLRKLAGACKMSREKFVGRYAYLVRFAGACMEARPERANAQPNVGYRDLMIVPIVSTPYGR